MAACSKCGKEFDTCKACEKKKAIKTVDEIREQVDQVLLELSLLREQAQQIGQGKRALLPGEVLAIQSITKVIDETKALPSFSGRWKRGLRSRG
jgi:hypothetical protein